MKKISTSRNQRRRAPRFVLVGKNPAIDFANTVVDLSREPAGALRSWDHLLAFLEATGSGPAEGVSTYRERALRDPRDCAATFSLALKLRDEVRSILADLAAGTGVRPEQVQTINRVLAAEAGYTRLIRSKSGWQVARVKQTEGTLDLLLPVARAAAEIIVEGAAAGIQKCANPDCILFFQDKNRRRRWCSMTICGNRAKVAAHWRRQHGTG